MAKPKKSGLVWAPEENWQKLRSTPECVELVNRLAREIAAEAGGEEMGFVVTPLVLEESRAAASVMATGKAHFHNRKHHSLIRALSAVKKR